MAYLQPHPLSSVNLPPRHPMEEPNSLRAPVPAPWALTPLPNRQWPPSNTPGSHQVPVLAPLISAIHHPHQGGSHQHTPSNEIQPMLTSGAAFPPKTTRLMRLHRDTPIQGHIFRIRIGNSFTLYHRNRESPTR